MLMEATRPTSRVLVLLELLQDRPGVTGTTLANELGVSTRTIRRYITILQEMGIPVEPAAGRIGGYWLRPGFRMPPLMFSADEAIGLAVALLATRVSNDADLPGPVASALAKIERTLPTELAGRIATIRDGFLLAEMPWPNTDTFPNPTVLATLIQGSLAHQQVWMRYGTPTGDQTARTVDPYGVLVFDGRWYLHGWCHLRKGTRTFRVDRVRRCDLVPTTFVPPEGLDLQRAILGSIASSRDGIAFDIMVDAPLSDVARYLSPMVGSQEAHGAEQTRVFGTTGNLAYLVWRLLQMPFPFTVTSPQELREEMRQIGERLLSLSDREAPAPLAAAMA